MQTLVASSVILLSFAIQNVETDTTQAIYYLIAFCISLVLVYVPHALSMVCHENWKYESYQRFVDDYAHHKTQQSHDKYRTVREKQQSILSSESRTAFYDSIHAYHNFFATMLNGLLSVISVIVAVDSVLLPYYLCAIGLMIVIQFKTDMPVSKRSRIIQKRKNITMQSIFNLSETILLKNPTKMTAWHTLFSNRHHNQRKASVGLEWYTFRINMMTSMITLMIIVMGNLHFIHTQSYTMTSIALVIATMPRQVQILQSGMQYLDELFNLKHANQKLVNILKLLDE